MVRRRPARRAASSRGEGPSRWAESARRDGPIEEGGDGDWVVRPITGAATGKSYRCPGCDQEIRPGTSHVVTWPAYARASDLDPWDTESAADLRRHWHTACWRARDRRR